MRTPSRSRTTLASISQGIALVDAAGGYGTFNARVCEPLDLPKSLLDARPLLTEVMRYQRERATLAPRASGW